MEFRQLKYFVAVAEEGNFGGAAKLLNISQPPITRQIRKLEEELDVVLFTRTPKGAELTPAGKAFLEDARQTLAQLNRGVERSRAAQRGELGSLEIGYFGSPIYRVVPALLRLFREKLPDVRLQLHRLSKNEQIAALQTGQIHVGFGRYYQTEPRLSVEDVITEGLAVAVPTDFTADPPDDDKLSLFQTTPLVLFPASGRPNFADEVIRILKREGVEPKIEAVTEDIRSALTLTSIGMGATIVPGTVTNFSWSGVRFIDLESLQHECPVHCIYRKSDTSPLVRAMIKVVQQYREQNTR